jgi:hypothetical protein
LSAIIEPESHSQKRGISRERESGYVRGENVRKRGGRVIWKREKMM